jgi:hypothetical protein
MEMRVSEGREPLGPATGAQGPDTTVLLRVVRTCLLVLPIRGFVPRRAFQCPQSWGLPRTPSFREVGTARNF